MELRENRDTLLELLPVKVEMDGSACKHLHYKACLLIAALLCQIKGVHMVPKHFFCEKNTDSKTCPNVSKRASANLFW